MNIALKNAVSVSERRVSELMRGQQTRRKIQNEASTYQLGIAANLGLPNRTIAQITGLSQGQIGYRMKETGASEMRRQYRSGEGPVIQWLMKKAQPVAQAAFVSEMQKRLELQQP